MLELKDKNKKIMVHYSYGDTAYLKPYNIREIREFFKRTKDDEIELFGSIDDHEDEFDGLDRSIEIFVEPDPEDSEVRLYKEENDDFYILETWRHHRGDYEDLEDALMYLHATVNDVIRDLNDE